MHFRTLSALVKWCVYKAQEQNWFRTLNVYTHTTPCELTCCLAKVLEGFTHRRLLKQVNYDIDPRQYAREGHSTTQALIYLLHVIHEAVDTGNCSARCESVVPFLHGATPMVVFYRELNLDLHFFLQWLKDYLVIGTQDLSKLMTRLFLKL